LSLIDNAVTINDAAHVDHSPHLFVMSNGDLVCVYLNGSNLGYRIKTSGAWGAFNVLNPANMNASGGTPNGGPYARSYATRLSGYDDLLILTSVDATDTTHYSDFWRMVYTPGSHTFTIGSYEEQDNGVNIACGIDQSAQTTIHDNNNNPWGIATLRTAANQFGRIDNYTVTLNNPLYVNNFSGTTIVTTFGHWENGPRCGVVVNKTGLDVIAYGCLNTGTVFICEHYTIQIPPLTATTVESPPAFAFNPTAITACWDGTNFVFIANEANSHIRVCTRTGSNVYTAWTNIVTDGGLAGEPVVCVRSNGDLLVLYETTTNYANGEIWYICRVGGTWQTTPTLLVGGSNSGYHNVCCQYDDINDTGRAHILVMTGSGSPYSLQETVATIP